MILGPTLLVYLSTYELEHTPCAFERDAFIFLPDSEEQLEYYQCCLYFGISHQLLLVVKN